MIACSLVGAAAVAACATPSQTIEMEPMRFEVVDQRVEHMDEQTLYQEAGRAFEALDFMVAAKKYRLIVERFPDGRYAEVSAYNAGLSYEKAAHYAEAIPLYERVIAATGGSKDAQDALFRLAECHRGLANWAAVVRTAEAILAPHYDSISAIDRLAAHAVRGYARQKTGAFALAERDFKAALRLYKANIQNPAFQKDAHVALAQFQIGEIYRDLFAAIAFRLPLHRMQRDLEDKSNFFLMAQSAYLRALRLRHSDFSVQAGFRLGALYEVMYDDMMAAEIPPELNREQVELYYKELKDEIRPLLVRAIDIYERNLRMGQRLGHDGDWIRRTEASLSRLKEVLRQDSSREVEAELRGDE